MTLNRLFVICLAVIGVSWVVVYVTDLQQRADDREFYERNVTPLLKPGDGPFRPVPLEEISKRAGRRADMTMLEVNLFVAGAGLLIVWTVTAMFKTERFWKKRNAVDRAADVNAGSVIGEIQSQHGRILVARGEERGLFSFSRTYPLEVEVSFSNRTATFRGFRFIAAFAGNKHVPELVLPFADILGGRTWANHGNVVLSLRTTAGTVAIPGSMQSFQPLAAVLLDAPEVNRKNPVAYATAVARAPRIKTPWYGWLILVLAFAAVAAVVAALL